MRLQVSLFSLFIRQQRAILANLHITNDTLFFLGNVMSEKKEEGIPFVISGIRWVPVASHATVTTEPPIEMATIQETEQRIPDAVLEQIRDYITSGFTPKQEDEVTYVPDKKIQSLLGELMTTLDSVESKKYQVDRAKTVIRIVKNAEGGIEVGLGPSLLRIFDAKGRIQQEVTQGIEIEIARKKEKE